MQTWQASENEPTNETLVVLHKRPGVHLLYRRAGRVVYEMYGERVSFPDPPGSVLRAGEEPEKK